MQNYQRTNSCELTKLPKNFQSKITKEQRHFKFKTSMNYKVIGRKRPYWFTVIKNLFTLKVMKNFFSAIGCFAFTFILMTCVCNLANTGTIHVCPSKTKERQGYQLPALLYFTVLESKVILYWFA